MKLRKFIAVLVLICMMFTQQSTVVFAEVLSETIIENVKDECPETGVFGENDGFAWTFDSSTKTMTITGSDLITFTSYIPTDGTYDINKVIFKNCGFSEGSNLSYMFYLADMEEVVFEDCDLSKVVDMQYMFSKCPNLISVDMSDLDLSSVTNMEYMFADSSKLVSVDLSNVNASNVTSMRGAFRLCKNLTSINLTGIDTSKVTDMSSMFTTCTSLTSFTFDDLDTASVTTTTSMFNGCTKLTEIDITNLSTSNITDMSYMFYKTGFLTFDLSNMDLSGKNLTGMFYESSITEIDMSNADVSDSTLTDMFKCNTIEKINMSNLKAVNANADNLFAGRSNLVEVNLSNANFSGAKMSGFFASCDSLTHIDLSNINTTNVTDMSRFFDHCYWLESVDISGLDTESVTSFASFFGYCNYLVSVDLSTLDTSSATDLSNMFYECKALTSIDVSDFDTSNVTNMSGMFNTCTSVQSIDLTGMDTSNVTNMSKMFASCDALKSVNVTHFDTSNVTNMSEMFAYGVFENIDVSGFDVSKVTNMKGLFSDCDFESIDVSQWDTSNVTDMSDMFYDCANLTDLDVSNFDTSLVTNMYGMFYNCSNLSSLDVSQWNTSNVTNMSRMFFQNYKLNNIDVSKWDTSKVTTMEYLFYRCRGLTTIDVSNWSTSKVTNMGYMFAECSVLSDIDMSNFDTSSVTHMNEMFSGCSNLTELDLSNFNTSKVKYFNGMFKSCTKLKNLDVRNFELNVTSISDFLYGCNSLESIATPKVINSSIRIPLPHEFFYDAESTTSVIDSSLSGKVLFVSKPGEIIVVPKEYFMIKVVDSSNSPLSNVLVTYDGTTGYTDENGEVQFEKSDKEKPIFTAELEGYITWTNDNPNYVQQNEVYETIVLYGMHEGDVSLQYAYIKTTLFDGYNVLLVPYIFNLNKTSKQYTLTCAAYDTTDVKEYQLWQDQTMIASSATGEFHFTTADEFVKGGKCYIKTIKNDDTEVSTYLNFYFYKSEKEVDDDFEYKFGGDKVTLKIGDDVPFFGGGEMTVETPELPFYVLETEDKLRIGINYDLVEYVFGKEVEIDDKSDEVAEAFDDFKKLIANCKGNYKSPKDIQKLKDLVKVTDGIKLGEGDFDVTMVGYAEANYGENTATGEIIVTVSAETPTFGWNTIIWVVPVTVNFNMTAEGEMTANLTYDIENAKFTSDLAFKLAVAFNMFGGVGATNVAGIGFYGECKAEATLGLADVNSGLRSLVLSAAFGVMAYVGPFEYKQEFNDPSDPDGLKLYIYPNEDDNIGTVKGGATSNVYDASAFEMSSLSYLSEESKWNGNTIVALNGEAKTNFHALLEDTYRNARPMMISEGEVVYATFLRADEQTNEIYAVITKCAYGTWSEPVRVDETALIDGSPQLFRDSEGNLWIAYTRTLEGDNSSLLGYAKNQRIVIGKVDKDTLAVTELKEYASNGFANTPQFASVNGVPTLVWVESTVTDDNSVLSATTNMIKKATYSNGAWTDATDVTTVNYYLQDVAFGDSGYAVIVDTDNNLNTSEDRKLKIYNWSGSETSSVDGVNGNVTYGKLPGTSTSTFIWNSIDSLCSTSSTIATPAITSEYAIVDDKIYYSTSINGGADLVVVSKNSDGTFSSPVQLTDTNRYLENLSVVSIGGSHIVLGMHTNAIITEDDVIPEKNLVWALVQPVNDVRIDSISCDRNVVTAGSDVPVTLWVSNIGLETIENVSISVDGNVVSTQTVSLKPGEMKEIIVNVKCPSSVTEYTIQVVDTSKGLSLDYTPENNTSTLLLGHSDVAVSANLQFVGDGRSVIAVLENKGIAPASGTLTISDKKGTVIVSREFSDLTNGSAILLEQTLYGYISDESLIVTVTTDSEEVYTFNNMTTVYIPEYEDAPEEEEDETVVYTVKFDGNGATSGSMSSLTCEYDTSYKLPANSFVKTGYAFDSWNTRPDGTGNSYADKETILNLTDVNGSVVTLYAQWEKVEVNIPDGWNQGEDGNWYYYKDNKIDTTANGILPKGSEYWYAVNGKADFTITTVAQYGSGWWYVKNGKIDFTYFGVGTNSAGSWYIKNGQVNFGINGLAQCGSDWYYFKGGAVQKVTGLYQNSVGYWYVKDGKIDFSYFGVASNNAGTWYVKGGQVNFGINGLAQCGNGTDWYYFKGGAVQNVTGLYQNAAGWWYVKNGKIDFNYTGLANNSAGYWYVKNGKIDFSYFGVASNNAGTWYVKGGQVNFGINGLAQCGSATDWYYFKGGAVQKVTGLYQNSAGYWYVKDGKIDFTYYGVASNDAGTWYVKGGQVNFGINGLAQCGNGTDWYYFKGGAVQKVTGLYQNSAGWWYVKNGKIDFAFTGIGKNDAGFWYCVKGKVDFTFNGIVEFEGHTYNVVNGKATLIQ